ncbi:MAG TPA: EVE domain-containing protein [Gemmatimonadaceae bacterium]|nr:EVE domain-containing protein [Gemmatimonadaceae bacterium]
MPAQSAPRARPVGRRYWLVKSEPNVFSFDDLVAAPGHTTGWDGVRNYQARNFMRDDMRPGDGVLFYHSSCEPPALAGIAEVARAAYPDPTAFDPRDPHHDPKSRRDEPTWYQVDVRAIARFETPIALPELRDTPGLEGMELLRRGSRLSVQPVTREQWEIVTSLRKQVRV